MTALSSETIHASCVAIIVDGAPLAVLLSGRSGAGKSDLALRLIDRGAKLVSDDYTLVRRPQRGSTRLIASAPATIAGKLEVRGLGIVAMDALAECAIGLFVALDEPPERMPENALHHLCGTAIPAIRLAPLEPSAPLKVELALARLGLRA